MRRLVAISAAAMIAVATATAFAASPPLILKAHGQVLSRGAPIWASLEIEGFCTRMGGSGALLANKRPLDKARFRSGGPNVRCSEGRLPFVDGTINLFKLMSRGNFVVVGHFVYDSANSEPERCVWEIKMLSGTFAIPGPVKASDMVGVGTLNPNRSELHCPGQRTFGHVRASLGEAEQEFLQAET